MDKETLVCHCWCQILSAWTVSSCLCAKPQWMFNRQILFSPFSHIIQTWTEKKTKWFDCETGDSSNQAKLDDNINPSISCSYRRQHWYRETEEQRDRQTGRHLLYIQCFHSYHKQNISIICLHYTCLPLHFLLYHSSFLIFSFPSSCI